MDIIIPDIWSNVERITDASLKLSYLLNLQTKFYK